MRSGDKNTIPLSLGDTPKRMEGKNVFVKLDFKLQVLTLFFFSNKNEECDKNRIAICDYCMGNFFIPGDTVLYNFKSYRWHLRFKYNCTNIFSCHF